MIIEKKESIKNGTKTIVRIGNKSFIRIQNLLSSSVQWKRVRTNHLVKAYQHKELESKFELVDNIVSLAISKNRQFLPSSGATMIFDFEKEIKKQSQRFTDIKLDAKLIEFIDSNALLAAVKYYKDATGLGLKESKEYVDALKIKHLATKNRKPVEENFMKPKVDEDRMKEMNAYFPNNAKRKQFIQEIKKVHKEEGTLRAVKSIKDKTEWGLYESKMFFDNVINK